MSTEGKFDRHDRGFAVELEAGAYLLEWHSLTTRETKGPGKLTVKSNGNASFAAPFAEARPAVLYLKPPR